MKLQKPISYYLAATRRYSEARYSSQLLVCVCVCVCVSMHTYVCVLVFVLMCVYGCMYICVTYVWTLCVLEKFSAHLDEILTSESQNFSFT